LSFSKSIALMALVLIVVASGLLLWEMFWRRQQDRPGQECAVSPSTRSRGRYSAPTVSDPALIALVNRNAKVSIRVGGDSTAKLPIIQNSSDAAALAKVLADHEDHDVVRNEVANLLRRSSYDGLSDVLIEILGNPAEGSRFRSFCIQHLWKQLEKAGPDEREQIVTVLHQSLADRHVEVRREALLSLVRMRDPKGQETALAWLVSSEASADAVRDLAIRCVQELDLREHIPEVRKHVRSSNEVLRIAAIVALSQWADEEGRPAFEEAAKSSSVRLQRAGKAALERLDKARGQKAQAPPAP